MSLYININNTEVINIYPFPIRNETSGTTGAETYNERINKAKRRFNIVICSLRDYINLELRQRIWYYAIVSKWIQMTMLHSEKRIMNENTKLQNRISETAVS